MQFEEFYLASVFCLALLVGVALFVISSFYVANLRRAAGRRTLAIWHSKQTADL